jgi:hypothetical protein
MFKKAVMTFVFFALASVGALAADFNGKWTASVETQMGTQTITFDFHVDGSKLTGTVTSPRGESQITDGKVDGDSISFVQVINRDGDEFKITYAGKAEGADSIKFTRQFGDNPGSDFTATRAK